MSRFTPVDLSAYPIGDVVETLAYESYLARDRADFAARWAVRRAADPTLPPLDAVALDSDPSSVILEVGSYREALLRARVNDALRGLTLAGASGRALDHIGVTYYRAPRLVITPATASAPAVMEGDERYRQRLALTPESWSTAGPVGAYLWHALSASGDVLDVAVYSEDEGVCLAPTVRVVALSRLGDGVASPALIAAVQSALDRDDVRPMSDHVIVESASVELFDVSVALLVRPGAAVETVRAAAETRLRRFCLGLKRSIGSDDDGPVWLVGRTFTVETLAGAAMGGDDNILGVDVAGADVNAPHASYTAAALAGVGTVGFAALPDAVTRHLVVAPRLGALTVTASQDVTGWAS